MRYCKPLSPCWRTKKPTGTPFATMVTGCLLASSIDISRTCAGSQVKSNCSSSQTIQGTEGHKKYTPANRLRCIFYRSIPHQLFSGVRHQCDLACTLNCNRHLTLVACTVTGNTPWKNFATLGQKLIQATDILIICIIDLVDAELANLTTLPATSFARHKNHSSSF